MFESHRKFKSCILCGRRDLTREHIFGKSFAAHLDIKRNWAARTTPESVVPFLAPVMKGSSPITNIAPRLLCAKCNNERLTGLMSDSLRYLKDLSDGNPITFEPKGISALKGYFERMALILDVCTSNEQLDGKFKQSIEYLHAAKHRKWPAIVKFQQRQSWLDGAPLVGVSILIGHHTGILGLNPVMNFANFEVGERGVNGYTLHPAKRVSIALKELAICINIGMSASLVPCSFTLIDDIAGWPTHPKVTYDDFWSLWSQDYETCRIRNAARNPQFISEMERLSRQQGTITFPAGDS